METETEIVIRLVASVTLPIKMINIVTRNQIIGQSKITLTLVHQIQIESKLDTTQMSIQEIKPVMELHNHILITNTDQLSISR